jgi:hypothetical protein
MRLQSLEPGQLVLEFGAWLRIAVGEVDAANQDAVDGCLDVAGLIVLRIAGQGGARDNRFGTAREDGGAVPGPLTMSRCVVAGLPDRLRRKLRAGALELLQANDVGLCVFQPG